MGRDLIVLDTHAWVWWLTKPTRIPRRAMRVLEGADRVGIAAITVWEVAAKAEAGKWKFDRPYDLWIDDALAGQARLEVLPLLPAIAVASAKLPWSHGDPADRFIVATARAHHAQLITADERISDSGLVHCVWD